MSKDHLRFFTKESAVELFLECGFKIENTIPTGLGHMIKILPTLTAFQFVYVTSKN
jgi:citrate lyase synthetase